MSAFKIRTLVPVLLLLAVALPVAAQIEVMPAVGGNAAAKPAVLDQVGIDQRLGQPVPLDLPFRDESGKTVHLGDYFGQKPVILALVYYQCPMLCTETLNGLTSALSVLKFDVGREFSVVTVSFDPRETPKLAAEKKRVYLHRYGRSGADRGWHFLTGDQPAIDALTRAVGFRYFWDQDAQQFGHATAIMVLTPHGKLAQYYYGVEYPPGDLRLALVEASANRIGNLADKLLLYCYHYDPRTGRYGAIVTNLLRISGAATLLVVGSGLLLLFRREPRRRNRAEARQT